MREQQSVKAAEPSHYVIDDERNTTLEMSDEDNATITSNGSITVSSDSSSISGIFTDALKGDNFIKNSGSISAESTDNKAYGINVDYSMDENASIQNSGNIFVVSDNTEASGIVLGSGGSSSFSMICQPYMVQRVRRHIESFDYFATNAFPLPSA